MPDTANTPALAQYHARMQRVLAHIDAHLDNPLAGELTVDALSAVAAFSPYHFHRQFTALYGLSVHRYIQLLRMKRAAYRLAFRCGTPVTEIAYDSSYASPEAFSRAFKQHTGQHPSAFRNAPDWMHWQAGQAQINDIRSKAMNRKPALTDVRIIDFPEITVGRLEHHGDPATIGDTIRRFIAWRKAAGLPPRVSRTFNILHVDPDTTAPEDYRLDLCAATDRAVAPNAFKVIASVIPAGRCAVLRQTGAGDDLRPTVRFLYAEWLPRSGETLRDFPVFAERVSFFPDVPEHEAVTDVFLPLGND